jgi:DNA polymerase/3'-5' exonuclease PolX
MSNKKIISEFERLIAFITENNDKLINSKNNKEVTANQFRLRQLKNVLAILKKYPKIITKDNFMELKDIQGIGKGTIDRIKEILENGKLSELNDFVDTTKEKQKSIEDLESVVGIGHAHALELYNLGITSVKNLIKKVEKGEIEVNDKIQLGLKYYGKFEGNIPRKEITKIYKLLESIIDKLNAKLSDDKKFIFEICGSYRREKPKSGDIDVLISKLGSIDSNKNYLLKVINLLKEPIKKNDNKPLLIDDLTDFGKTKYMGFLKYKDNPPRRIDIRFINNESWYSALLYFTGSAELNKQMRQIAKSKKLKLSEYGLFKENGEKLEINSEHDVFDILGMEYLIPRLR